MRVRVGALIGAIGLLSACIDEMHVTGVPRGTAGSAGVDSSEEGSEGNSVFVAPTGPGGAEALADGGSWIEQPDAAFPAFGPVQCGGAVGCSSVNPSSFCLESVPGGVCAECAEGSCPAGTQCIAPGALASRECARACADDADCNVGLACRGGHCTPRSCAGPADCPAPYAACSDGHCARPRCDRGLCPPELVCAGSGFCVEPELAE